MSTARASAKDIDEYIASFPPNVQKILRKVRRTIHEAAPQAKEAMKYGLPTFILNGNLVHFGAFQRHIGFYPTPTGIERFKSELEKYPSAKGSVQFPLDQPIPYDLISEIVRFRVQERMEKGKKGSKKK